MARAKKNELRCRVTIHLPGGARPGDIVTVNPADPWILAKINRDRGPLVPLDDSWVPPAVDGPDMDEEVPTTLQAAFAGSAPSSPDDASPLPGEG